MGMHAIVDIEISLFGRPEGSQLVVGVSHTANLSYFANRDVTSLQIFLLPMIALAICTHVA